MINVASCFTIGKVHEWECNLLSNYLGNLFKGESLWVGLGHDALTFTC